MIGYAKCFDSNETMCLKVSDKKLLKKHIKICEKISDNDKYEKIKIKSCGDKMSTNFQGKKNTERKCIIQMFVIDNAIE